MVTSIKINLKIRRCIESSVLETLLIFCHVQRFGLAASHCAAFLSHSKFLLMLNSKKLTPIQEKRLIEIFNYRIEQGELITMFMTLSFLQACHIQQTQNDVPRMNVDYILGTEYIRGLLEIPFLDT